MRGQAANEGLLLCGWRLRRWLLENLFLLPRWYMDCCVSGYCMHTFFQILCVAPKALDKNEEGCPQKPSLLIIHETS